MSHLHFWKLYKNQYWVLGSKFCETAEFHFFRSWSRHDNFVFCFLHTYSSAVLIFILISASPPSQPAFFLHSDWLILKLWTTFIMAAEIPSPPSKNYHLKFSECQNIPENIVPIEILTQNSILNFMANFQCQMIL